MSVVLTRSTAQSISNNTWTNLEFPVADEVWDNSPGWHAGPNIERVQIEHGPNVLMLLNIQVFFAANTSGRRMVRLMKDGTTVVAQTAMEASSLGSGALNLTKLSTGNVNTRWHVEVHQTSGGALDIDPSGTVFAAVHVGFKS